ncbi:hypothetical protein Tdes44962_MAKER01530 [Teratosphaeria destructans]|uniref:Uncharacterized protein n=1 Tax=Teratosphaeria destructans TaxID=418781 RepID=A0A9W7SZU1_9PEZI|nr:hypothetical protein Tdes44962_MAKER01530 [Teratosphaeria destructans]
MMRAMGSSGKPSLPSSSYSESGTEASSRGEGGASHGEHRQRSNRPDTSVTMRHPRVRRRRADLGVFSLVVVTGAGRVGVGGVGGRFSLRVLFCKGVEEWELLNEALDEMERPVFRRSRILSRMCMERQDDCCRGSSSAERWWWWRWWWVAAGGSVFSWPAYDDDFPCPQANVAEIG